MTSKHSIAIREAFALGYRIDDYGLVNHGGKTVKATLSANGYYMFSFKSQSVGWQRISVSKFAGYQKFGDVALGQTIEVRHLNGRETDNRLDNLAIGTPTENRFDMPEAIRRSISIRAASFLRKLSDADAEEIRRENAIGISLKKLALRYGVSKTSVSYIVNRKTYA